MPGRRHQLDLPLRAIDLSFVQMLTQQLRAGLIREVGVSAFAVLTMIRSACRNKDGRSYISSVELGEATGLSQPTIRRAIDTLTSKSLVQVFTDGSKKRYFILDHLPYLNTKGDTDLTTAIERLDSGESDGKVMVRYIPGEAATVRQQIANWAAEGAALTAPGVQVVPAQVVNQQLVKEAYIERLVVGEVVRADGTPLVSDEETGPFQRRVLKRQAEQERQREADAAAVVVPTAGKSKV